jgi:hypothetical protein
MARGFSYHGSTWEKPTYRLARGPKSVHWVASLSQIPDALPPHRSQNTIPE